MVKTILLLAHPERAEVPPAAETVRSAAARLGVNTCTDVDPLSPPDLVLVLGGDGTILNGARIAWQYDVPLIGINFGRMGFLADTSKYSLSEVVRRLRDQDFTVEQRMTLDVSVTGTDGRVQSDWALNEAVVQHSDLAHPANLLFAVDGQAVSTYGADGIIFATPTGSTAYSFSAGGPVVWPDTEAIVMAPLAAHGLFTRPLVVSPKSVLEVRILDDNRAAPRVLLDGIVGLDAPAGSVVKATRGRRPVRLIRLDDKPFAERLVSKFSLPVRGWRSVHQRQDTEPSTND